MHSLTANVYEMRGRTSVAHIPPMPLWVAIIRLCQFILVLVVFSLTTYAKSVFNYTFPGFGMAFFVFAWTSLFLGFVCRSVFNPIHYNKWIHLGLETLTVIFWLITWALLASETSTWSDLENVSYTHFGYTYPVDNYLPVNWKSAINCAKASAGLAALEWVLFIITLVFLGMSLFRIRAAKGSAVAPVAAPMTEEYKMNAMTMPQPVVQDPRYRDQQMA